MEIKQEININCSLDEDLAENTGINLWVDLLRVQSAIQRKLEAAMLAEHTLQLSWFDVLVHLYHAPEQTLRMNELAEQIIMSGSGLTRLVDRMVKESLLERLPCASDRRVVHVTLTDSGRERLEEVLPGQRQRIHEYFSQHLTAEEIETLKGVSRRLLRL